MFWLIQILGHFFKRTAVRLAASQILKKHGQRWATAFFKQAPDELLKAGSTEEIVAAAKEFVKTQSKKSVNDEVFSRKNAKKVAALLNKGTDYIESKTKQAIIKGYANLNNRKLADTLKTLSTPGFGTPGKEGIDILGIEVGGKFTKGKKRSGAYNKVRDAGLEGLRATIVPQNRKEAFAVAYARGLIGELTGSATASVIAASPRAVLGAPRARAFMRTLQSEVEFLRNSGQVKTAAQLNKAIKKSAGAARDIYGNQEGLVGAQVAGYTAGRLTPPIVGAYVLSDDEERQANVEKFRQSISPFIQQQAKTWVDAYQREDGTKVRGHYRRTEYQVPGITTNEVSREYSDAWYVEQLANIMD